jgi:hypothetical protein
MKILALLTTEVVVRTKGAGQERGCFITYFSHDLEFLTLAEDC